MQFDYDPTQMMFTHLAIALSVFEKNPKPNVVTFEEYGKIRQIRIFNDMAGMKKCPLWKFDWYDVLCYAYAEHYSAAITQIASDDQAKDFGFSNAGELWKTLVSMVAKYCSIMHAWRSILAGVRPHAGVTLFMRDLQSALNNEMIDRGFPVVINTKEQTITLNTPDQGEVAWCYNREKKTIQRYGQAGMSQDNPKDYLVHTDFLWTELTWIARDAQSLVNKAF